MQQKRFEIDASKSSPESSTSESSTMHELTKDSSELFHQVSSKKIAKSSDQKSILEDQPTQPTPVPFQGTVKNLSQIINSNESSPLSNLEFTDEEDWDLKTNYNTLKNTYVSQIISDSEGEFPKSQNLPNSNCSVQQIQEAMDIEEDQDLSSIAGASSHLLEQNTPSFLGASPHLLKTKPIKQNQNPFKYSRRNRAQPVQHWKGEQLVYKDEKLVAVRVTKPEEPTQKHKPKKHLPQETTAKVWDTQLHKFVSKQVCFEKELWSFQRSEGKNIAEVAKGKQLNSYILDLKPLESTSDTHYNKEVIGFVIRAQTRQLLLYLDQSEFVLNQWSTFIIPSKNSFSLKNLSNKMDAKIELTVKK